MLPLPSFGQLVVPPYSSNPSSTKRIYLDFDGFFENYGNSTTPTEPFSLDSDFTTFSATELAMLATVWRAIAEDYAPFDVNVTTIEPVPFSDATDVRIVIGGSNGWLSQPGPFGKAIIGSYFDGSPNVCYVFRRSPTGFLYGSDSPLWVSGSASHEAGHAYGFDHVQPVENPEYLYPATIMTQGDFRRPVSCWRINPHYITGVPQDCLASLCATLGTRVDDHGGGIGAATPLSPVGNRIASDGIIATSADLDVFSFTTLAGPVNLQVFVAPQDEPGPAYNHAGFKSLANLNVQARLLSSSGTLAVDLSGNTVPVTNPFGYTRIDKGAVITAALPAGTYYLEVGSSGGYGELGYYAVRGTLPSPSPSTQPPKVTAVVLRNSTTGKSYSVPAGDGIQIRSVQVGKPNQVSLMFSEPVTVAQVNLTILRNGGAGSAVSITGFSYNSTTYTATWTFTPLVAEQLLLKLDGTTGNGGKDSQGNLLDGEWINPGTMTDILPPVATDVLNPITSLFPSGNGVAGGDFNFRVTILAGDIDSDGEVTGQAGDVLSDFDTHLYWFATGTHYGQSDCDADGDVDLSDFNILKSNKDAGYNFETWP